MNEFINLSRVFQALGHPLRLEMVQALARTEPGGRAISLSIADLADQMEVSRFSASRHLSILRDANVVIGERDRQRFAHRLNDEALAQLDDWLFPLLLKSDSSISAA